MSYISWAVRSFYHLTLQATPCQSIFGRVMIFHLPSIIYLIVLSTTKQQQVYTHNVHENTKKLSHDYIVGDLVYFDKTGIYLKLNIEYQKSTIKLQFTFNK